MMGALRLVTIGVFAWATIRTSKESSYLGSQTNDDFRTSSHCRWLKGKAPRLSKGLSGADNSVSRGVARE